MPLFDTHLHVSPETDLDGFESGARAAGVEYLLANASDYTESLFAESFAKRSEHNYFAAGVHAQCAASFDGGLSRFRCFAESPRFVSVGEIGLDYYYDSDTREVQLKVFQSMLGLALELNRPAQIHLRDKAGSESAYSDALGLLSNFAGSGGRFEIHCYAGSPEDLEKFAALGAYFGVGGMLTFKAAQNIRELALKMPRERILLETDSPYLAPVPFRGRPNCSAYLPKTAEKLAELLGLPDAAFTTENAFRFFGIKG